VSVEASTTAAAAAAARYDVQRMLMGYLRSGRGGRVLEIRPRKGIKTSRNIGRFTLEIYKSSKVKRKRNCRRKRVSEVVV